MPNNEALQALSALKVLQECPCGWETITSTKGLEMYQGKKGCLKEGKKGNHTEKYFLVNQLSRVKSSKPRQYSQDIITLEESDPSVANEV